MCSLQPKKQPPNGKSSKEEDEKEEEIMVISSHMHLKPAHRTGNLDKAVVLRRIRHRKRINKVKAAVQALLGSSSGETS
ncbi:hypothetical protein ABFS82_14G252500 [Erythranthe guttata]